MNQPLLKALAGAIAASLMALSTATFADVTQADVERSSPATTPTKTA